MPGEIEALINLRNELLEDGREDNATVINDALIGLMAIKQAAVWGTEQRPAPQVHFRVNVSGLKRVPDATFTMDGDIRDINLDFFFSSHDAFQAEVDKRYPLPDAKVSGLEVIDNPLG